MKSRSQASVVGAVFIATIMILAITLALTSMQRISDVATNYISIASQSNALNTLLLAHPVSYNYTWKLTESGNGAYNYTLNLTLYHKLPEPVELRIIEVVARFKNSSNHLDIVLVDNKPVLLEGDGLTTIVLGNITLNLNATSVTVLETKTLAAQGTAAVVHVLRPEGG